LNIKNYILELVRRVFGYCGCCQQYFTYPKRRRMNTAYVNEESNYCCLCLDCYEEGEKYWEERWEDYYRSIR